MTNKIGKLGHQPSLTRDFGLSKPGKRRDLSQHRVFNLIDQDKTANAEPAYPRPKQPRQLKKQNTFSILGGHERKATPSSGGLFDFIKGIFTPDEEGQGRQSAETKASSS